MMSAAKSRRSLPRAKDMSEVLLELMGKKRYNEWFGDSPWWLESGLREAEEASRRSRIASTKRG
jgi:hypothetical protein